MLISSQARSASEPQRTALGWHPIAPLERVAKTGLNSIANEAGISDSEYVVGLKPDYPEEERNEQEHKPAQADGQKGKYAAQPMPFPASAEDYEKRHGLPD